VSAVRPFRLALAAGVVLALACGAPRRHSAHGVVIDVERAEQQVVIDHGEIPGLMGAMTMNFDVPDEALLATLAPGQVIDFEVEFTGRAYRVVGAVVRSQHPPPREEPPPGQVVDLGHPAPDFTLTDQDGRRVSLADLRGRLVVLDFIYTRCPGPCPTLTGVHAELQRRLPPALRERTHFVSISLDPARDTPEALRAYARARGADLSSWWFLTGAPEAVDPVLARFGVGRTPREDGEIDHRIVTFLLDSEGRIARRWTGLDHEADELLADLARVAGG
jgi:protein SCO1/2